LATELHDQGIQPKAQREIRGQGKTETKKDSQNQKDPTRTYLSAVRKPRTLREDQVALGKKLFRPKTHLSKFFETSKSRGPVSKRKILQKGLKERRDGRGPDRPDAVLKLCDAEGGVRGGKKGLNGRQKLGSLLR